MKTPDALVHLWPPPAPPPPPPPLPPPQSSEPQQKNQGPARVAPRKRPGSLKTLGVKVQPRPMQPSSPPRGSPTNRRKCRLKLPRDPSVYAPSSGTRCPGVALAAGRAERFVTMMCIRQICGARWSGKKCGRALHLGRSSNKISVCLDTGTFAARPLCWPILGQLEVAVWCQTF